MPETTYAAMPDASLEALPFASQDLAVLHRQAQTHWAQAVAAEKDWRTKAMDDQRFAAGEQWPEGIFKDRDADERPCLVIDRMGTHLRQVDNEGRQAHLGIVVSPVDDKADPETAKIIRGHIRNIEQQSHADVAYTTARNHALRVGRGFVRVLPVYADPFSFKQELRILPIRNVFSVYLDPAHMMPDASDCNWGFIVTRLAKDDYERTYRRLPMEAGTWAAEGDDWFNGSEVQVAEYFWREQHPVEIVLLNKPIAGEKVVPRLIAQKQIDAEAEEAQRTGVPVAEPTQILQNRMSKVSQVWWAKINGHEVLEQTRWLGQYIPIAQVIGELEDLNGKLDYKGPVRRAKDPQQMMNYWFSAYTEAQALAPRNAFVGTAAQFEGYEDFWDTANKRNWSRLIYNDVAAKGGGTLPPPQRSAVEPAVQAMAQGIAMATDHLNAISGYHEQVQDQDPAISGEAIRRRQQGTNNATFHYQDHERWMLRHLGRILVDAIPYYYDEAQSIRIVGDNDEPRQVTINERYTDEDGKEVLYDLTVGQYDVRVDGGKSYATKRQEGAEKLGQLIGAIPDLAQVIGDDYVQSLDFDLAQHAAERIRKTMPPQLLEGEPGAAKSRAVAEQMQQLQQVPQMVEQLKQQASQLAQMQQAVQQQSETIQQQALQLMNKQGELELKRAELALDREKAQHEWLIKQRELGIDQFEADTKRIDVHTSTNGTGA